MGDSAKGKTTPPASGPSEEHHTEDLVFFYKALNHNIHTLLKLAAANDANLKVEGALAIFSKPGAQRPRRRSSKSFLTFSRSTGSRLPAFINQAWFQSRWVLKALHLPVMYQLHAYGAH